MATSFQNSKIALEDRWRTNLDQVPKIALEDLWGVPSDVGSSSTSAKEVAQKVNDYTKDPEKTECKHHQRGVWRMLPLPDQSIASASYDHTVKIWNLKNESRSFQRHSKEVLSLALTEEGTLLSGSTDGTICEWNIQVGALKPLQNMIEEKGKFKTGIYSLVPLDAKSIATGSCQKPPRIKGKWDHVIKVWDKETKKVKFTLKGHTGGISTLLKCGDDQLISSSADKTIRIWDTKSQECKTILKGHKEYIYSIDLTPSKELISGGRDRTIRIWDIETEKQQSVLEDKNGLAHASTVYQVSSFQDDLVLSGSRDGYVKIWDKRTLKTIKMLDAEGKFVYSVTGLANGAIAAGTCDQGKRGKEGGSIVVWQFP
jgi:WD40 repeat protein